MLASDYKKELLIVNEQPDLMAEITQLDSDEGIPEIVWSMAIYDFNKQNITMTMMDYSVAASHIQELCKSYSDTVGLEGDWLVTAGFSSLGMSNLGIENYQSPNTRVQVVIDNGNNLDPLKLNFHAMSVLINTIS